MISIQTFAIGLLATALLTGGAYLQGRADGRKAEVAERATLEEVARVSREEAVTAAANAISKITTVHKSYQAKTEVITREKPVYRDCVNDAGVERVLDSARENRAPEPAADSGVPGSGTGKP